MGECGRKWPENGLAVRMPCNPVTLCRNLRISGRPSTQSSFNYNNFSSNWKRSSRYGRRFCTSFSYIFRSQSSQIDCDLHAQQCLGRSGLLWWYCGVFVGCSMKSPFGIGETKTPIQRLVIQLDYSMALIPAIYFQVIIPLPFTVILNSVKFLLVFDSNLDDISYLSMWSEPHFDPPNLE